MNFFKRAKNNAIISALAYIVIGLLLAIWPTITATTICYILAVALLLFGIISIFNFFTSRTLSYFPTGLVGGLFTLALGVLLFAEAESIIKLIPVFLGICILVSGVVKLCHAFSLHRAGYAGWTIVMVFSIIGIVFGLLMAIDPFMSEAPFLLLVGIGIIYSGVSDLWTLSRISKRIRELGSDDDSIELK